METSTNMFDLFEHELRDNVHAAFTQEALLLLKEAELVTTKADELFTKVDNMLTSASDMLEYNDYLNLVAVAFACGQHNHALLDMLQTSSHNERRGLVHGHDHDDYEKKDKKETKAKKANTNFWFLWTKPKKDALPKGFLDMLMGVK